MVNGNLSHDQFFHGTSHNIKGGKVLPANDAPDHVEVSDHSMGDPGDMSEGDHAFAIRNNEGYAWAAARTFHPSGRARVYEVEPAPDMKPGPWNKEHPDFLKHHEVDIPEGVPYDKETHEQEVKNAQAQHQDEWASPTGFKVRKRIDIMPNRQGTFPQVNWNRYSKGFGDANHPTNQQVVEGTHWNDNLEKAHQMNKAVDEDRSFKKRGSRLRAFMMGQPDPGPLADHPKLF